MLTEIPKKMTIYKLARSKKVWLSLCVISLVFHLFFVQSLGYLNWKINWEKWQNLRPTTEKVALNVEEQTLPPPPPPQKTLQRQKAKKTKKVARRKSQPARRKKPPTPAPPPPREVAQIQSVEDLMEPYELARDIEEEIFSSEEIEEITPPPPIERISKIQEDKIEEMEDLSSDSAVYKTPEESYNGVPGGFEDFQGSFSSYLGLLRRAGLDAVFVIDSTGSMGWVIDQVKAKINDLMNVIRRLVPTARIGLVSYRDRDDEYVTKLHPLTFQVDKLKGFLNTLKAEGGGDWEEAVEEGLEVAVERIGWRRSAKKIIILVGDAPPHKKDMKKAMSVVGQFRQQGGFVSIIDASHESNDEEFSNFDTKNILQEFIHLAAHGQGECTSLGRQKKIVQQLVILTFGSRWEEVMAEYVEGL